MAERPSPPKAQDKLAFLLSLVPYLIDHDSVSVPEAAEHFGVPEEQIRDAVRLIGMSGIPGETATYQHGDLFDIAWDAFEDQDQIVLTHLVAIDESPRFSSREAAALIAGLQYLSTLPEHADRAAIESLKAKLARGASAQPAALAVAASESDATLAVVRESVDAGLQLEFDYLNARGVEERRRIDPLRVQSADADWYVRGWDHKREAVRTFRLDRISGATVTDRPITHEAHDVQVPDTLFERSDDDLIVVLDVASSVVPLVEDYIADSTGRQVTGDRVRITVRFSHYHGLKRLVAATPGVIVVEPPEAREVVAAWARAGIARYGA